VRSTRAGSWSAGDAGIAERANVPSVQPDSAPVPPTTVLRLITRMNIGGPARQAILLTKGLSAEFPTLLAAGRPAQAEGELTDPAVPVRHVPLVRPVRPLTDLSCLVVVRSLLHESGARLVHTHMAKAGTIGRLAGLTSGRRRRPRLVHTFHGHVLHGYFAGPQQRAFVQFERFLAKHTDVLIAVSPEVRDELLDLGIGKAAQYRVVPLGFDLAPLLAVGAPGGPAGGLRAVLGIAEHVPLAGTVGRLVPVKDHATLFSAVASVPGLHLAILGDGELRATLEALARELGISDRTHFVGWWTDLPSALADLDVVVLSSRNEGTPVALIEALAASRPVVATDVGGVRHVVQDGETGRLCGPGDAAGLARLLQQVIAEPEASRRMAEAGRLRVAARFGYQRLLADHQSLYEELLAKPRL
jgi:glycosyltransferase involved in cell wall biosynthesis